MGVIERWAADEMGLGRQQGQGNRPEEGGQGPGARQRAQGSFLVGSRWRDSGIQLAAVASPPFLPSTFHLLSAVGAPLGYGV